MKYKKGVAMDLATPHIWRAVDIVEYVGNMYGYEPTITSGSDGTHSEHSLHYTGNAIDVRIKDLPTAIDKETFMDDIYDRLPDDYDVVLEATHIHIEWDPK